MRVSVWKSDPGYPAYVQALSQGYDYAVGLNGIRVERYITADDMTGEVVAPVLDHHGLPQNDPVHPGQLWQETRRGLVTITRRWRASED